MNKPRSPLSLLQATTYVSPIQLSRSLSPSLALTYLDQIFLIECVIRITNKDEPTEARYVAIFKGTGGNIK